jgi:hypothetical protein
MQLWEADLKLGRQFRKENCGPELSRAHTVVGLMNLLQREIDPAMFLRSNSSFYPASMTFA